MQRNSSSQVRPPSISPSAERLDRESPPTMANDSEVPHDIPRQGSICLCSECTDGRRPDQVTTNLNGILDGLGMYSGRGREPTQRLGMVMVFITGSALWNVSQPGSSPGLPLWYYGALTVSFASAFLAVVSSITMPPTRHLPLPSAFPKRKELVMLCVALVIRCPAYLMCLSAVPFSAIHLYSIFRNAPVFVLAGSTIAVIMITTVAFHIAIYILLGFVRRSYVGTQGG